MHKQFVHLNVHSEYSVVDSTIRCSSLAKKCQQYGMPAVAITDVTNMYGAIKHYSACINTGLKPLIGAHIWVTEDGDYTRAHELILLTMNKNGFQSLCRLISQAFMSNQHNAKAYVDAKLLYESCTNMIALSAGHNGLIGQAILAGDIDAAQTHCQHFKAIFGNRFYIELQRLGRHNDEDYIENAISLASALDIPVVATNAVAFMDKEGYDSHEIRVCIQEGRLIDDKRRKKRFTSEQYLKTPAQMDQLFSDYPEAIANSVEIAKRCNTQFSMGETFLPKFEDAAQTDSDEYLSKQSKNGLAKILKLENYDVADNKYKSRLTFELDIINQMGFSSYFLIVADFIAWGKNHGIPVGPGRGSGAGSLVAYALGITQLDPIEHDLLFERFLNPERVSMPDFDIDFCMVGRDRVIEYVTEKYGSGKVAQIITFGTMAARAVVRDVGRVLGLGYGQVDKIAKLIPFVPGMTLEEALKQEAELKTLYDNDQEITELIDNAKALEGIVRNVGKHAGGVVIAPTELTDFSPLYTEQGSTQSVTQFDKDDLEAVGLVKFDFLGLKTLTVIDWALKSINEERQRLDEPLLDTSVFDMNDVKTFELLKAAQTTAVFQLESRGMKDLINRLQPDKFDDLTALVALYRPGPLESGMVDDYVNRKHGLARVVYHHPLQEQILKPTYGVILYQEQVMQTAQVLAGYSLGNADLLRRAMGKKKPQEMAKQRKVFIEGSVKNNISAEVAEQIFDLMEKFAGYGFNKSHSAAYAMVSFQTAWLKANYASHFIAAALSVDMDNTEKVVILIAEARNMGLSVEPPDINRCEFKFTAKDASTILYGLGAIKGLGHPIIEAAINERKENGVYSDLFNLCQRVVEQKLNRRALEALACSGALDCFNVGRASLNASITSAIEAANQRNNDIQAGQADLFGMSEPAQKHEFYITVPNWRDEDRLKKEKAMLGLYLSGHPIDQYRSELDQFVSSRIVDLRASESNQLISGLVISVRTLFNRRGGKFAFVTLDDNTARIEVSVFAELFAQNTEKLHNDSILVMTGKISIDERNQAIQMRAESIYELPQYRETCANALVITVSEEQLTIAGDKFNSLVRSANKGDLPIVLRYTRNKSMAQIKLGNEYCIKPENSFLYSLEELFGKNTVKVNYSLQSSQLH